MPSADAPDHADNKTFGDTLREQAALIANLADRYAGYARIWPQVYEQGKAIVAAAGVEPPAGSGPNLAATEQQARLLSQATAALAFAHDEMMASGGPGNPAAYARYVEAGELYQALLAPGMRHEPSPPDSPIG